MHMFAELGHFALILALAAAFLQVAVPAYGLARRNSRALAVAGSAAQGCGITRDGRIKCWEGRRASVDIPLL